MLKQLWPALLVFALLPGHASAEASASSGQHFVSESKIGQWKASKLVGLKVYNSKNENIGQITELLLDQSGTVEAVVISVGGFLGVGQRDIAVPYKDIHSPNKIKDSNSSGKEDRKKDGSLQKVSANAVQNEVGTPAFGILDLTADEVKAAPQFKYVQ
jgi:sporulation protein YlmC with PRC-barrel domain